RAPRWPGHWASRSAAGRPPTPPSATRGGGWRRAGARGARWAGAARGSVARVGEAAGSAAAAAGLWQLLLAHIAGRWAAMVGVPPEGRGVVAGPAADQLAQALGREAERLRGEGRVGGHLG